MNNFIFETYLKNSNICDEVINFFNEDSTIKNQGKVGHGINKSVKDSTDSIFNLLDDSIHWVSEYRKELIEILKQYERKYLSITDIAEWGILENSNIQYYKPNCGFKKFHCERSGYNNIILHRHLVFMTYLNDVKKGGETEFYYQKVKIKARKGKTLIWPADWTHTHRGIVSPTEEKYIITGWISFMPTD